MEITYDYYRIFYYVAKYKSFTTAAEVLSAAQPNLTKFISNLEAQLGCKLFARSNRGVKLTDAGERLYAHVSVAYKQFKEAESEIADLKNLENGTVTVGITEIALHKVFIPVIDTFHRQYPKVKISILNYSTPQALKALKDGLIDFGIVSSPVTVDKTFHKTVLKEFREILVGGKEYRFLTTEPHLLRELSDYSFVGLRKETATHAFYNDLFLQFGKTFQPDTEAATADQLVPLLKCGIGIGFVPESFAENAVSKKELYEIPLSDKIPLRQIFLIEDKNAPLGIAANALKEELKKAICRKRSTS